MIHHIYKKSENEDSPPSTGKASSAKRFLPLPTSGLEVLQKAEAEFYDVFQQFVLRDKGLFPGTYAQMADTKHEIHAKKKNTKKMNCHLTS